MVANRKVTGTAVSIPVGIAWGVGIALMISVIGALLFSKMVDSQVLPENGIGYIAMSVILASSAIGAWVAGATIKHRRLLVCLLSGAVYYALLLAMTALLFGGQYQGMGVTALLVVAGCGSAALLNPSGRPKQRTRTHRTHSR